MVVVRFSLLVVVLSFVPLESARATTTLVSKATLNSFLQPNRSLPFGCDASSTRSAIVKFSPPILKAGVRVQAANLNTEISRVRKELQRIAGTRPSSTRRAKSTALSDVYQHTDLAHHYSQISEERSRS